MQIEHRQAVYTLTHVALRDAILENDPSVVTWIRSDDEPEPGRALFEHLALVLKDLSEFGRVSLAELYGFVKFWDGNPDLLKCIRVDRFQFNDWLLAVVTLPPPLEPMEAYYAIIAQKDGERRVPLIPSQSTRFFVLERAVGQGTPFLCEWRSRYARDNLGQAPLPEGPEEFARRLASRLEPRRDNGDPVLVRVAIARPDPPVFPQLTRGEVAPWNVPRKFESISDLFAFLKSEHKPDRHAYRGQIGRRPLLTRGEGEERADIEALFPSDFRFSGEHPGDMSPEDISRRREYGRDQRDAFTHYILEIARAGAARVAWLQELISKEDVALESMFSPGAGPLQGKRDPSDRSLSRASMLDSFATLTESPFDKWLYRAIWSLGQHYLLPTCLLDLTHDPRIAAWFATNPWEQSAARPRGLGVIYRFNLPGLQNLLERGSVLYRNEALAQGLPPPPKMFVVDISRIPPSMALRPSAQSGLSLYGFDRLQVIQNAFFSGATEAFVFEHGDPFVDGEIRREVLKPENDPFLAVLSGFTQRTQGGKA